MAFWDCAGSDFLGNLVDLWFESEVGVDIPFGHLNVAFFVLEGLH
jgi:hypothetical protein